MTDTPIPTPALAPHIVCDGAADAIEFYKQAFGATEMMRMPGQDGRLMHAAVIVNGAVVMMVDENKDFGILGPNTLGGSPVTLHLYVADADASIAQAEKAGATVTMPAADMFWGDRYGQVKDPWGHNWSIAHPLGNRPLGEDELRKAAKEATCGQPADS
jgi:PhnB protein